VGEEVQGLASIFRPQSLLRPYYKTEQHKGAYRKSMRPNIF